MVHGSQVYVLAADKCSVLLCDAIVRADDALGGDAAQADDDLRANEERFVFQIRHACLLLCREWVAVSRGMALYDIGDVYIFPAHMDAG